VAYCNRLSVKITNENSSEDEFETLHGPVRPYLFDPTAKPGAEWINLIYLCRSITQKLVLGSFDNINFKCFFFAHRRYSDKLIISNYLSLDLPHSAYSLGDSIFFTGFGL